MHYLLLLSALAIGCLLAVQASVNLQLNRAVGTPYGASALQLGLAAGLLLAAATAFGALGALGALPDAPWWHLLGGLASPLYITSGILLFPRLGALTAVGLFVTGQMFASLGLDLFGLLGVPERPLSPAIALGAVAVLAGISVIVRVQQVPAAVPVRSGAGSLLTRPTGRPPAARAGWLLLGLLAGAVLPVQGAVNARLRGELHEPLAVGVVSFTVATLTIVIVLLVLRATGRTPRPAWGELPAVPWWGWLGGACAAAYVVATFMLIPQIGAATTIALTVTGQQLASAAIDQFGAFRMARRPLTRARLTGLGLLILGCLLVQLG